MKVKGHVLAHLHKATHRSKSLWFFIFFIFQIEVLNKHLLLTSKPVIYLVNLSEKDYIRKKNKWSVFLNKVLLSLMMART